MLYGHGFPDIQHKTEDFYKDIADDIEARFDTSGYVPDRPLPVGLNKKVIGLMKDELGGEIMREFVSLWPKMYSYKVGNSEPKKCKRIKKCVVKKTISFDDYIKKCLQLAKNEPIDPNYYLDLANTKLKHSR